MYNNATAHAMFVVVQSVESYLFIIHFYSQRVLILDFLKHYLLSGLYNIDDGGKMLHIYVEVCLKFIARMSLYCSIPR